MKNALYSMRRSKWITLLIAIQISAVFALLIIFTSALKDRTNYYSIYKDYLSKNGIIIHTNNSFLSDEKAIKNEFDKATNIFGGKSVELYHGSIEDYDFSATVMIYGKDVIKKIPPFLDSGEYPKSNSEYTECLACKGFGFKVGDIITFKDEQNTQYKVRVSGILADNQRIFGTGITGYYKWTGDYRDLYFHLKQTSLNPNRPLLLTTDDIATGAGLKPVYQGSVIINFPEDAYDKDTLDTMAFDDEFKIIGTTNNMNEASKLYVNEQLYILLPIAIAILIVTLFTAITTSIITTIRNLKRYAILYICGSTWKHCALINVLVYLCIIIMSVILDILFFLVGKNTFLKSTVVSVTGLSLTICAAVTVVFIILALVVPILTVRNTEPREVLKKYN